ncbi:hypothetical protein PN836_019220 [Ningiella sp. W23]|uniref:hypothetical protein n=1 Tax=Ningiella sp. W23 TaxID=3023715 RepID=UPI0037582334
MKIWIEYHKGIVAFAVIVIAVIAYIHANNTNDASILQLTIPLGMLGAVLREYAAFVKQDSPSEKAPSVFVFSVIIGGILSLILTLLFASGLLAGQIFPNLTGGDDTVSSIQSALRGGAGVATNADLYKLLLWALIAGFADNFVLNKLSNLTTVR